MTTATPNPGPSPNPGSNPATDHPPDPATPGRPPVPSSFAPFRHGVFAVLWGATVLSNMGGWMHDVGASWLMTTLAPSPIMVALVQTATTLPVFLFALPAGALADIVDRRRLLIVSQIGLALVAAALGLVVMADRATPVILVACTFLMGLGAALTAPAWQALVPTLVPKPLLQPAVAMNSVGVNISRAIGPAVAGFVITAAGVAYPFLINAASYLIVVAALLWWRPAGTTDPRLPPEHLVGAIRLGLAHARHNDALKATLWRAVGFFLFASAFWSLLPLITRTLIGAGAEFYGILLGCVGAGAVSGALGLGSLRRRLGADRVVLAGTVCTAGVLALMATGPGQVLAAAGGFLTGVSWIAVLTSLNVSAQVALPDWVRARGLSLFVTVFFGSMTAGSLIWGQVATLAGIPGALMTAAAGAVLVAGLTWRFKLGTGADLDLAPSMHWPAPVISAHHDTDTGPVLVSIEYQVAAADRRAFLTAIAALAPARGRIGGYDWGLFEDTERDGVFVETFKTASWIDHLRQHDRVTNADKALQAAVHRWQVQGTPAVRHWIAAHPPAETPS